MNYKVYVPSMSRAGVVTTHKLFPESTIVCPESQVKDYKEYHDSVLGVPDEIKGITATRNWILNNCDDEWMIQVDDDARAFRKIERDQQSHFTDPERIDKIVSNMFVLTSEWGLKCWGLAMATDHKYYREYCPFVTQCSIGANIIGIIRNPLRFDERLKVKEDYDYSMQHIYKYGGALRFNKYGVDVIHLTNKGGCVDYRTKDTELEAYEILLKKWGKNVVRKQPNHNFCKMRSPRRSSV